MMEDSLKFLSIDEQAISNRSLNQEKATNNLKHLQQHIFQSKCSDFPKCSVKDSSATRSSSVEAKSSLKDTPGATTSARPSPNDCSAVTASKFSSFDSKVSTFEIKSDSSYKPLPADSTSLCNPSTGTCRHTAAMEGCGKDMIINGRKGSNIDRQSSVNEEELFGYGKNQPAENQVDVRYGHFSTEYIQEKPEQGDDYVGDNDKFEKGDVNSCIPNFGLLASSSGSESDSSKSPTSFKINKGNKVLKEKQNFTEEIHDQIKFSDGQDSDFKMRFQGVRSISAVDRREKYRNSSGGEVFDPDIEYIEGECSARKTIVQSNSLPDLVISSNQSPFSPPRFNSNPKPAVEENLGKQFEFKKMLEGTSSMPLSKEEPKVRRSVSIKEEPEFFPAENHYAAEDDENRKSSSKDTEERRRILSSGYGTASSEAGSQDKTDLTTSRQTSQLSQSSSGVWTSQETENENAESVVEKTVTEISSKDAQSIASTLSLPNNSDSTEINRSSPLSFVSGGNDSNSTESSVKTVCEANEGKTNSVSSGSSVMLSQINDMTSSGDLPNLSIMATGNRNEDSLTKFKRLLSKDEKYGARSKTSPSFEMKPPESFEPQSHGNLPNFLTMQDSFSLKPSSLEKVKEEDEKNHKFVLQKYGEAGLGIVQPSQGSMHTYSPASSLGNQVSA